MSVGPKKVLLVDDEHDVAEVTRFRLAKAGFEVTLLTDGAQALDYLMKNDRPDLILLDFRLPGMQGDEVCKKIKQSAELSALPVIIISASQEHINQESVQAFGAAAFLIKPFDFGELLTKIIRLIQ